MTKTSAAAAFGAALLGSFVAAQGASAQMMAPPTGAELIGHSVQVDTNGTVNTIYFDPGGAARITSPSGTEVRGNWFVENQSLCLTLGPSARECWPYQAMFQTGQPVVLTSNCAVTSRWIPVSTAPMAPPPAPPPLREGERG